MRPYRQIAKNNSYLAAVSSGQSQGTTIETSLIKLKLIISVNGVPYTSEQKFSSNVLSSIGKLLDEFTYTRRKTPTLNSGSGLNIANKFSVHLEDIGSNNFTSCADGLITITNPATADLFKTIMKPVSLIAKKSGTLKSAGINVVTNDPMDRYADYNHNIRFVPLGLLSIASQYFAQGSTYYAPNKCFYSVYNSDLYKIPFDLDTLTFGTGSLLYTGFSGGSSLMAATNLKDKIIRQKTANTINIFDCVTETVTNVTLTRNLPSISYMAWDERIGALRYVSSSSSSTNITLQLNGAITINTGGNSTLPTTVYRITDDYIYSELGIYKNTIVSGSVQSTNILLGSTTAQINPRMGYVLLNDGISLSFDQDTSSTNLRFAGFTPRRSSLGSLPDVPVSIGDSISFTLTLDLLGG